MGDSSLTTATANKRVIDGRHHVAGVLSDDKKMTLYLDGEPIANATASSLLAADPKQGLEIGDDLGGSVSDMKAVTGLTDSAAALRISPFSMGSLRRPPS